MSSLRARSRARAPGSIEPCQPTAVPSPPPGPGWLHEIKFDGYRMMVRRDAAGATLLTRNGHDWSTRHPQIVSVAAALPCRSYLIDGEVVVADGAGLPVFELLRSRKHDHAAFLYAFDLLELDGEDWRQRPIEKRKAALARLLRGCRPVLQLSEHMEGDGAEIFTHACRLGLEGIVSKRLGSRYISGRTTDWLKAKNPGSAAAKREAEEAWT